MAKKTDSEKDQNKAVAMATFGQHYEEIQAAKAALADLEAQASDAAALVVKDHGKGPHKLITSDGHKLIVTFQNVNKAVRFTTLDVTDL